MGHPHELSSEDKSLLAQLRESCGGRDDVRVPAELYEKVEGILGRMPGYESMVDEDGEYVLKDGRILEDYDKPIANNVRFLNTAYGEPNFMFRGTVVMVQ